MNRVILFLLLFTAWSQSNGQNTVFLQTDKTFYVAGDVMRFQLALPAEFRGIDVAIRAAIHHPNGIEMHSFFLQTAGNNHVDGAFKIPYAVTSGYYPITLYTSYKNDWKDILLLQADIPIYNDLEPIPDSTSWSKIPPHMDADNLNAIAYPLENIHPRTQNKVEFQIQSVEGRAVEYGNLSISIIDSKAATLGQFVYRGEALQSIHPERLSSELFYKGTVTDINERPYQINILGVFFPKTFKFYYTKSDSAGKFILTLPAFHNQEDFQFVNYENKEIKVRLKSPKAKPNTQKLLYDKDITDFLIQSRNRKKINTYFSTQAPFVDLVQDEYPSTAFTSLKNIDVTEYKNFPDLATFFNEVPNLLIFTKNIKEKTYSARIQNPQIVGVHKEYKEPPLFIIDGKVTRDANFIGHLEKDPVQSAKIFFQYKTLRKYFSVMGQYGVTVLETSLSDIKLPEAEEEDIFTLSGFQEITHPDVSITVLPNEETPLFRTLIARDSHIRLDDNGHASYVFTTPDNIGEFSILMVSYGKDGLPEGSRIITFIVE